MAVLDLKLAGGKRRLGWCRDKNKKCVPRQCDPIEGEYANSGEGFQMALHVAVELDFGLKECMHSVFGGFRAHRSEARCWRGLDGSSSSRNGLKAEDDVGFTVTARSGRWRAKRRCTGG
uniref:Uncharacterized protein n=1 Tax=Oryza meridionalis TaxID=40149 RepID=A0A0E0DBT7_9ORYZ